MGGKLRHGDPGVRLFEASASGLEYFTAVPASFRAEEGKWRIAPYYHLFGSDELSQRAPVFQSRMPEPYIVEPGGCREAWRQPVRNALL